MGVADDATVAALRDAVAVVEHPMAPSRTQRYDVTAGRGGHVIAEEGDRLAIVSSPQDACGAIVARARRRSLELASLKGWVQLRGALLDLDGSRILLVGPGGAGKTVLALRLALAGALLQGDDSVLLRDGSTIAFPALPVIAPGAQTLLPELATALLPGAGDTRRLDPARALGVQWRLRIARVDHVVVLEQGEREVSARPTAPAHVLAPLTAALAPVTESKPVLLRALTAMLAGARCHTLSVGDPLEMERAVRRVAC